LQMILVNGAAGKTGRAAITALVTRGQTVRALVHRDEQIEPVKSLGAKEAIVGDMRDESTLRRATQGVRAVYHICPNVNPDEITIGKEAIAAAQNAEVERFVFHSVMHPQTEAMTHHWNKLRVEEALFESGLAYTILQPASYMQNVLASWQTIVERGVYAVPYSVEARMSMVDLEDVARAAALVLTEPGHVGATYELAGPEVLAQTQVAEILSKHLKRPVRAEQIAIEAWTRQAQASGMGNYQIERLVKMFLYYDRYGFWGNPRALTHLLGRTPTRFEAFVERVMRQMTKE
jgi:NAD(P)H dehydrogenase (quinone)